MRVNKVIEKGGYLVLSEAGGKSALSTYFFIHDVVANSMLIALDTNKKVLDYWRSLGVIGFLTMKDMVEALPNESFYMLPCSEYDIKTASQYGIKQALNTGNPNLVHNKLESYKEVKRNCTYVQLPELFELPHGVVVRGVSSSGSKDTHIYGKDYIVTEKIQGVEYEVDFNTYTDTIYPLLSYSRKNGYNNHVCLIGALNPMYFKLKKAVADITKALHIEGVGTVQFIYNPHGMFYIEAALRIHGSSRVFFYMGGNPVLGIKGDLNFDTKEIMCDLGMV